MPTAMIAKTEERDQDLDEGEALIVALRGSVLLLVHVVSSVEEVCGWGVGPGVKQGSGCASERAAGPRPRYRIPFHQWWSRITSWRSVA